MTQRRPLSRVAVQRYQSHSQRGKRNYVTPIGIALLFGFIGVTLIRISVRDYDDDEPWAPPPQRKRLASPPEVIRSVASESDLSAILPVQPKKEHIVTTEKTTTKKIVPVSQNSSSPLFGLPEWTRTYLEWHSYMRHVFPDTRLWDDPGAPGVLVLYCRDETCGGLYRRLGHVPQAVYAAAKMKRVLLFAWTDTAPAPLEAFLQPASLNWTLPKHKQYSLDQILTNSSLHVDYLNEWEASKKLFDNPLKYATAQLSDHKVLVSKMGNMSPIQMIESLRSSGETDLFGADGADSTSFGILWRALFQPHKSTQRDIDATQSRLSLKPHQYSAVHCRVHHAVRSVDSERGDPNSDTHSAQLVNVLFQDAHKEMAVSSALHGVQCSKWLGDPVDEPIYIFSDSQDLVNYMVQDVATRAKSGPLAEGQSEIQNDLDAQLVATAQTTTLVGRSNEIIATDQSELEIYRASFVDLYLAIGARCVTLGVGNFATLATQISGTTCTARYEYFDEAHTKFHQKGGIRLCPI